MNIYSISNPNQSPVAPALCDLPPMCSTSLCDTSLTIQERAASLVASMTLDEKIANSVDGAPGVSRLGLPSYEWWNEALHGLAFSKGVLFQKTSIEFNSSTSFPMPITIGAAFDDPLVYDIATQISTEARAFNNFGFAGLDFWTPNINPYRDPRWGRGQETPGEDVFHIQSYVYHLITGLQGGLDPAVKKIIATCKHFAAYDIETNRAGNELNPTAQDLAEYYTPSFKTCVRDAKAGSVMCSYNAVDGVPSCASRYLLQNILREQWGFNQSYNSVVSDCDAIEDVSSPHHYVASLEEAAAVSLNAGTDLDCGFTYSSYLGSAIAQNMTTESTLDQSLTRLYSALIQVGYFNPPAEYSGYNWSDVGTPTAIGLAYKAALEGAVLLKNDGLLPLPKAISNVAIIGPWANAEGRLLGNYFGRPTQFVSPLSAFQSAWSNVVYEEGTEINTTSTSGFSAALAAASTADYVIYLGGIDETIEAEGLDRVSIAWPGNQLDLIGQIAALDKKFVVVQCGGGQVDDTAILNNTGVNALLWVGYPGQEGGRAIRDILDATFSVAGRLPVTQYPADYINGLSMYNMNLRPSAGYPGRTYKWYSGISVIPFGYGLHYASFSLSWESTPATSYSIASLVNGAAGPYKELAPFATLVANVQNAASPANIASDYVGLLFISTTNGGPAPYPNKALVSYGRLHNIPVDSTQSLTFNLNLTALTRPDSLGNIYIYPGDYTLALDIDNALTFNFTLTGTATLVEAFDQNLSSVSAASYVGCYTDDTNVSGVHRTLGGPSNTTSANYPQLCVDFCVGKGYALAGVEYGT